VLAIVNATAPLFAALLGAVLFGERVSSRPKRKGAKDRL